MNIRSERAENIKYFLLLGSHTMMMCTGFNFVTYYLLNARISDGKIGILVALSCLAAVVIQPVAGRAVDRGTLSGKSTLLALAAVEILAGLLVAFHPSSLVKAGLFGLLLCITLVFQPILNSFSFFYQNQGISVNYGAARGVGSICYSGISILLGFLTVHLGTQVVPITYAFLGASFLAVMCFMPVLQGGNALLQGENALQQEETGKTGLKLSAYPAFVWMLAGLSLTMMCHNMIMTYFIHIIERAGGDSSNMGIANGIAAVVEIPVLFLYTKIKGKTPSRVFLTISGAAFFTKAVLFIFARSVWMIYGIQCLQCLAYGLMAASRVYYVDETVGKEHETTGQAYMSATETIGILLGSTLGGFLMQWSGTETLLLAAAAMGFAGVACMLNGVRPH